MTQADVYRLRLVKPKRIFRPFCLLFLLIPSMNSSRVFSGLTGFTGFLTMAKSLCSILISDLHYSTGARVTPSEEKRI